MNLMLLKSLGRNSLWVLNLALGTDISSGNLPNPLLLSVQPKNIQTWFTSFMKSSNDSDFTCQSFHNSWGMWPFTRVRLQRLFVWKLTWCIGDIIWLPRPIRRHKGSPVQGGTATSLSLCAVKHASLEDISSHKATARKWGNLWG